MNEIDAQGFVTALKRAGSNLPIKDVSLAPYLENRRSGGYVLKFRLANTGNQNIELVYLEASVPKSILDPGWTPHADPAVVEPAQENQNAIPYLRLRYKTYDGLPSRNKHHIERLPTVLLTNTTSELGYHFSFPIKSSLTEAEKELPIYYRIGAHNANFPRLTIKFGELFEQLTAASEMNLVAENPATVPTHSAPQPKRSNDWLGDRTKNWLRR